VRYLIVSDLHICDIEEHPGGWKPHKSARYLFDEEFAALLASFKKQAKGGERLTLILNGDTFDFDLVTAVPESPPWKVTRLERRSGLQPTANKSIWKLERILSHHPRFVDALADFLSDGHKVVYILGNHDREFLFDEVKEALMGALKNSAHKRDKAVNGWDIQFEPWFYYVPDQLFAEHGHQYDSYTSYRYLLSPVLTFGNEEHIVMPMGNLSNRYLLSTMGYFKPYSADYILNLFRYVTHWLHYYALSKRSGVLNWIFGSLIVISRLVHSKRRIRKPPRDYTILIDNIARHYDLSVDQLKNLEKMQKTPITESWFRVIHTFWLDRLLLTLLMIGGTIALAIANIPPWIKLAIPLMGFPLAFFIYEPLAKGETIFTVMKYHPSCARRIAIMLDVPLVTFGHTHSPQLLPVSVEKTFVNTGTWAPLTDDQNELMCGHQNYLIATFEDGRHQLQLASWQ
jgi:UDP-2,3-diacylglucosamine pyrophosphatase LpxH